MGAGTDKPCAATGAGSVIACADGRAPAAGSATGSKRVAAIATGWRSVCGREDAAAAPAANTAVTGDAGSAVALGATEASAKAAWARAADDEASGADRSGEPPPGRGLSVSTVSRGNALASAAIWPV